MTKHSGDPSDCVLCLRADIKLLRAQVAGLSAEIERLRKADARLIAVAPDLIAALKQLVADYQDVPDATDVDGQAVFEVARAAIAKAEAGAE